MSEPTALTQTRTCPECEQEYTAAPRWRPAACPACHHGKTTAGRERAAAERRGEVPMALRAAPSIVALGTIVTMMDELDDRSRRGILAWLSIRYADGVLP